ncbi:MAG: transglutaminase-like domain-containing protein, partial [Verrucomicrobiales bacterium]
HQKLSNESFSVTAGAGCDINQPGPGERRSVRIDTRDLGELSVHYEVSVETSPEACEIYGNQQLPITDMEHSTLSYLFPSRYCESDRMGLLAAKLFGHIDHPLAQARAISDWVFENIDYVMGSTGGTTSAHDTLTQRAGVCRDFAHLAIALCRALSIPARYFSGYACNMQPPDFHACFEACVANRWFIFDPTRLSSPDGLIRIATGRDAADTSFATIFGSMEMDLLEVSCMADYFEPLTDDELEGKAIMLEP